MDSRNEILAKNLVNYSTAVQAGDKVYIHIIGQSAYELGRLLVKEVYRAGGVPFLKLDDTTLQRELMLGCTQEQLEWENKWELEKMKEIDCYIAVRAADNVSELSDVPKDKQNLWSVCSSPVLNERVNNTRWVVLRYPNYAMAQLANTSLDAFSDYYYRVCNLDYSKMSKAMDNLVDLMNRTDKVRIVGEGTDLSFSIKGIPAIKCAGKMNIPDGEVYTAPVKESVNGIISYNTPSVHEGFTYENIVFEFENGKIIKATANDSERINHVLDIDEGARYIGEFAIGVNPFINVPMKDTLFDEKIAGSIHFTPGRAYEDAFNGNTSSIHWDLVYIQTPSYGGGEIYFDDVLIRKDGRFVLEELDSLNVENLK